MSRQTRAFTVSIVFALFMAAVLLIALRASSKAVMGAGRMPAKPRPKGQHEVRESTFEDIANSRSFFSASPGTSDFAAGKLRAMAAQTVVPASFLIAPEYAAGSGPMSVAVGDINGDGIPDLAVANFGSDSVSILLGNGDGSFAPHVDYPTGKGPSSVALSDLNDDGKLDVIVSDATDGKVSVLKGNGDGTFLARMDFSAGTSPTSVVVADFDGDNKPDVVVVNPAASPSAQGAVSLLIGNGDGTFQTEMSFSVPYPISVAVADFNADGKADLVVANNISPGQPGPVGPNSGSLMVFLGKGDGSFQPGVVYMLGALGPLSVAIADLNADGKLDLIAPTSDEVTIPGPGSVTILLGNGDGSFNAPTTYITDRASQFSKACATAADFDGDGRMDLAISSSADNTVTVLLGNGDGTFRSQVNFGTGSTPSFVAAGDFNGDGLIDLVTPNSIANDVSVLLGTGLGTFQARIDYGVGMNPYAIVTGDFNGDAKVDIVTADLYSGVSVLLGNGNGTFHPSVSYPTAGGSIGIVAADFNRDSKLDVATANLTETVSVLLGNGDGTFQSNVDYTIPNGPQIFSSHPLATADFNGDGAFDLAVAGGGHLSLLLNIGDGTFKPASDLGVTATSVVSADFNGDGKADLGIVGAQVAVLLGNGNGTFQSPIVSGGSAIDLAVGDFDGNGTTDLVVLGSGAFSVLLGKGDGTFLPPVTYPVSSPSSIAVADLNGDGHPDIVVASGSIPGLYVFLNRGDGTFQSGVDFAASPGPGLAIADFNGDGKPDISIANQVNSSPPFTQDGLLSVLLNGQFALVGVRSSKNPAIPGDSVSFTAEVSPSGTGPTVATGTIILQDGSTALNTGTLSGATVMFPPVTLSAGTHSITARYSGDENFRPGSGGLRQVMAAPDFSIAASKSSLGSITAGQSSRAILTLNSIGGFRGNISVSCSVSPMPAETPSCALDPNSVVVGNGNPVYATLTVSTLASTAAFTPRDSGYAHRWAFAILLSIFPAAVLAGRRRRATSREYAILLVFLGILVCFIGPQVACGGGGPRSTGGKGTPPGNYAVNVLATSGGSQHATTLTLTVD